MTEAAAPALEMLLDDTEAQLRAASDALAGGDAVDLAALQPRIEEICRRAVEGGRRDVAPRLLALTESLDTLEALLRALLTPRAAVPAPPTDHPAGRRRVNDLYRTANETLTADSAGGPPDEDPPS